MINLNETPEALLQAKDNDLFMLDGRELKFATMHIFDQDMVYLTTTDSNQAGYDCLNDRYSDYIQHVREGKEGCEAVLPVGHLIECIKTGNYYIG